MLAYLIRRLLWLPILLIIVTFMVGMVVGYLFNALSNLRLRGRLMSSNRKLKKAEIS